MTFAIGARGKVVWLRYDAESPAAIRVDSAHMVEDNLICIIILGRYNWENYRS
jgi:hypothetical protein